MIVPGPLGWERWQAVEGQAGKPLETSGEAGLRFGRGKIRRELVLPVSHAWVMPAWLKGEASLVRDMAQLHLERLGVRVEEPERTLEVVTVAEKEEARLVTMLALKDEPTPLAAASPLPDAVRVSALALALPESSITVWRELGRLVMAVTSGEKLVYASPLSAVRLDERAIGEMNNVCLQLGFQRVLGRVEQLVVWLPEEEGDLHAVERATGLPTSRQPMPEWEAAPKLENRLRPVDLHVARQREAERTKRRVALLSGGLVLAAAVSVMMVMISLALREQAMLRDQVAELAPKAARVEDQRRAWQEAAPAVDPSQGPLPFLLGLQQPGSSTEVALMHVEFTARQVMVRGQAPKAAVALQFADEVKSSEMLAAYEWDTPAPELGADERAVFEFKGVRP